jgi:hemerythrin-like domain-containing protein
MLYGSSVDVSSFSEGLPLDSNKICSQDIDEAYDMLPIGPLMWEHRLIERMVALMSRSLQEMTDANGVNPFFIDVATDFLKTYADRCHHGKEEDILFRELSKKNLTKEHRDFMSQLVDEHTYARMTVGRILAAREAYLSGNTDSLGDIIWLMKNLVDFYPAHIEKEDKYFFHQCMGYLTQQEQGAMLQEFWDFDRKLIHEKYGQLVERMEKEMAKDGSKSG